ncbi:MAG TPA: molybdate ABC transporter substrate-binding protein [Planctomycetota bacterium]
MTILRARPGALCALLLLSLDACGNQAAAEAPVMVFAAASLSAPFQPLARAFEARTPGCKLELHFAGTSQLVVQVEQGAAVDVFASADDANMQKLVAAGLVGSEPRLFARNALAIATAAGNPKGIRSLLDLARADLRVLLCGPEVPAGRYAREALAKAAVTVRSVSDEPSVKAVVSKVQLGEVDAGIVYATDAATAGAKVAAVAIPGEHNVVATCPIAVLSKGRNRAVGEQFVAFVLSRQGQDILKSFGFQSP